MDCPECEHFARERERRERVCAAAIYALSAKIETSPLSEYRLLRKIADEATRDAEVARLELACHRRTHGDATA